MLSYGKMFQNTDPTLTWMEVLMINLLNALLELPTDSDGTIFLTTAQRICRNLPALL